MPQNARAYYEADLTLFASSSTASILGELAANTEFDIELAQRNAWSEQIPILKASLSGCEGTLFLEFIVPRIGSRIDAVLVAGPVIFVIEFKVGAEDFAREDINQVWDYGLDLKNFHRASHSAAIIPILVATCARWSDAALPEPYRDNVYRPVRCNSDGLSHLLGEGLRSVKGPAIDAAAWGKSPYQPTPTIIEAARALYSRHSVEEILGRISKRYPIALTRDVNRAKQWIREHARGTERYGLVASSGAQRLKPHAIDVRVDVDPVHWFLDGPDDTRSSYYLEDAATEFQVQGLELDWVCVTWDADLRFAGSEWNYHSFRGRKWDAVKKAERRQYLLNAYRVLLTRARQGMVICVPHGDRSDPTRDSAYYDSTFGYLAKIGIPMLTQDGAATERA